MQMPAVCCWDQAKEEGRGKALRTKKQTFNLGSGELQGCRLTGFKHGKGKVLQRLYRDYTGVMGHLEVV